ncbi:MAG: peptide chain release factor N(5)-glutamine methyltransferase [Planctomycetes bacterium]|nr:peptide chain release factor N(5)-glutamine methyltransferase [Planctomycetota bacterium]
MDAPRTAGEMLARAREFLTRKGTGEPRLEAELLVASALGLSRLQLFLQLDRPVSEAELAAARALLGRRGKFEPVAYITGAREFYGRPFRVDSNVLVPRPETELIVDLARERAKTRSFERIADVGTGSGCLAISLALECSAARVCAVDISAGALGVARANAEALGARVDFVEGDGPEALAFAAPFDLLVSNPPYIDPAQRASLAIDVREFEPALALFTPEHDREVWLRRLSTATRELVAPEGLVLIELGLGQAPRALEIARDAGWIARLHKDFGGIERVLELSRVKER